ncbi:nucleotide pyrophosphohydrolase [Leucobacter denitrificans]|uniref:Nucleotide pyrophosphohydrolase n=1 Tax=Leucobacter denitrificans TaxID=683042 RepID=A0A7G9S6A9_9MICO|nr:nucleotide pyrophosphohydrolase [Leucobacter denitrificans]QNN63384.1 nucleotide pyrophosphohydrolase [Leucobacter denitrificans]
MSDLSVRDELRAFVNERDWAQFHTPENLAKSISIEAAELLEHFQWDASASESEQELIEELADVLTYAYLLADRLGVDPEQIMLEKLEKTKSKYPTERSRGRSTKYDRL